MCQVHPGCPRYSCTSTARYAVDFVLIRQRPTETEIERSGWYEGERESRPMDGCQVLLRSLLTYHEHKNRSWFTQWTLACGVNVSFTARMCVNLICCCECTATAPRVGTRPQGHALSNSLQILTTLTQKAKVQNTQVHPCSRTLRERPATRTAHITAIPILAAY